MVQQLQYVAHKGAMIISHKFMISHELRDRYNK